MTSLGFDCTMCGRCCQDLKLPMSIDEAIAWLTRGNAVQVLTEAFVWVGDDHAAPALNYGKRRSVAGVSGQVSMRIAVTLVGAFAGACPYLLADRRCGGYEDRPAVCRIYPAEINPSVMIDPDRKACPSEAWSPALMPFAIDGVPIDRETRRLIETARAAGINDVAAKAHACALLGIADAAFANEGFAVHTPDAALLLAVLRQVRGTVDGPTVRAWRIVTNRQTTLAMLHAAGAAGTLTSPDQSFAYHGFFADEEPLADAA